MLIHVLNLTIYVQVIVIQIKVLENENEKLKVEIPSLTLVNLLNENIWGSSKGLDYSAYSVEHPQVSKPVLVVRSKNPKKTVLEAAEQIIEDVKDLRKHLQHASKE